MADNNELEVELKIGLSDEDKQKMADEIYTKVNDETQKELDEMHETIQSFGQLRPAGTDTSTNILNFKQDKGVYVATDNGYWYYWNGSAYVYGGVYQATEIADESVTPKKTNFIEDNVIYDNPLLTFDYNGAWQSRNVIIENIKPNTQYTFSVKSITGVGSARSYLYFSHNAGTDIDNRQFSANELTQTFYTPTNTTKIKIYFYATGETSASGTASFECIELIEGIKKIYNLNDNILVNIPNNSVSSNKIVDNSVTPKKTTFIKDNLIYENEKIEFDYNGAWQSQNVVIENIKENTLYNISFKSISGTHQEAYVYFKDSEGTDVGNKMFNDTILTQTFYTPTNTIKMKFILYATGDTSYSGTAVYEGLEIVEGECREYKLNPNINIPIDITKYNLPIIYLSGSLENISKENKVNLNYVYGERNGTCTLKWQGQGSLQYPKKNYTINFDNSFEAKEGWGSQK